MSQLTPSQLVFIARQHFEAGRLREAEGLCRKVLGDDPSNAAALFLAAQSADRLGQSDVAVSLLRRAVEAKPDEPAFYLEFGQILRRLGRAEEAIAAFREAAGLLPDPFDSLVAVAELLRETGQLTEATGMFRQALRCRPEAAEVWAQLGDVLQDLILFGEAAAAYGESIRRRPDDGETGLKLADALSLAGRLDDAIPAYRRAIEIDFGSARGHSGLGLALQQSGKLEQAASSYTLAISIDPQDVESHLRLGDTLLELGRGDEAVESYGAALTLKPDDAEVFARVGHALADDSRLEAIIQENLRSPRACIAIGVALQQRGKIAAAMSAYRRALQLDPDQVAAMNNLGLALKDAGQLDEAIALCRRAVALRPDVPSCHSNLLYSLHFHPDYDAAALAREHEAWRRKLADPLKAVIRPHANERSPDRRLRIAYLSPDFRRHPVGRFLTALFARHDHDEFEIACYSSVRQPDAITEKIRAGSDVWVNALPLSDAALAARIRADRIDILIDLTMHMANNRLLTFARKPAPVQMTYLAYCSTTGLDAIDYRISDPHLDPAGAGRSAGYAEETILLPETYWCYEPGIETPDVNALPALSRDYVTFASLNNFGKVSPRAFALWARLLNAVPASRLLLHTVRGAHRAKLIERFATEGIDSDRIQFIDMLPLPDYFGLYRDVDLALDPFPYPGGTTTCDALWMGVPTVSLVGQPPHTRSGLSILSNVGLGELATFSEEDYVRTAIDWARDVPRLAMLRATLRERLRRSPLMDSGPFARNIEAIYRSTWRRWCNGDMAPSS